jgi:pilus assembly protein FimV
MLFAGTATSVQASSLGPIQLQSGLGQPLRATIVLSSDDTIDLGSACVRARLEQSDGTFITTPRISLEHNAHTGMIDLTTKQSINEPAVLLHVEMGCGTSISRNYQLLLDPVSTGSAVHVQKAASRPFTIDQRKPRSEMPVKTTADSNTRREQLNARKPMKIKTVDVAQLPTFTKEMRLSSNDPGKKNQNHGPASPHDAKWIPEDSITPVLKLSASLADTSSSEDAQKNEEFKAAQLRFSAIVNGEDVTQNAETKMKAAQEKMLLLRAENEQKKQQAEAEKLAQDEKRKVSLPITWFAGLAALVLLCIAVIAWIVSKLNKAKKSPAPHPWKNYNAASDTLIADLSTQTLLDSEFLTTMGGESSYNTAVFSDTQFDPITEDHSLEDSLEDEHDIDELVAPDPEAAQVAQVIPAAEIKPLEKPVTTRIPVTPASQPNTVTAPDAIAKPTTHQEKDPVAVVSSSQALGQAMQAVKQEQPHTPHFASKPIPQSAPTAVAVPATETTKPKEIAAAFNVKEVADVMQQAEFWMMLQDPFRAIEILEPFRDVAQPASPVPWIYLLDLYRMVGDKKKYEFLIMRIESVFNAKIPRWDGQFGITPRTLNDFPHVVEKICTLWKTDEIVPYLESLLLDKRDGARQGFDLPVYRNIIQLITLARDPEKSKEHELRYGKAQAILFSQQAVHPEQEQPATTVIIKPASQMATDTATVELAAKNATVDAANNLPNALDNIAVETEPAVDPVNIDNKDTVALNEEPINSVSSQATNYTENSDDNTVDYGNASPMETKIELALAYQEIGEKDGARELLYEVIKDGSPDQSEKARSILKAMN